MQLFVADLECSDNGSNHEQEIKLHCCWFSKHQEKK